MSRRSKIIIFILIIAAAFVSAVFLYQFKNEKADDRVTPESQGQAKEDKMKILQQKVADTVKSGDLTRCDNEIGDEYYKIICINNVATKLAGEKNDASYCDKIDDKLVSREGCKRMVLNKKALDDQDVKICSQLTDEKSIRDCEIDFWTKSAVVKADIVLCDNIGPEDEVNNCLDNYLFKKDFAEQVAGFDCATFKTDAVIADCKAYQKLPKNKAPGDCTGLKTRNFIFKCRTEIVK